ncbi:sucrase ferredoxin [Calothrix sp. UHCC 0171]|uniref:sucrase ferredoxin n=1 Tax=Calothrix sp. UHCC 0171 TaxID=3110245 RepID=UPI002B2201E2|nr:sucrase ferredoxin [Calothrix sp. UHCC 0171]MEA5572605.1 sucrase ferredoxin [Calothrix sp. UHCC 0171]
MDNNVFCSDNSQKLGEDIIGSAANCQAYILIECPPPWVSDAFNSKWVPSNLKSLVEEVKKARLPIKFLLIANNLSHKSSSTTLLIYQRKEGLGSGYRKQEFNLPSIEDVTPIIRAWLWGKLPICDLEAHVTRDILVCAHGSHDRCCARYGNPFYFYASEMIADSHLDNVRIWKSTHFGGHRFAPTVIDLPEGRYYGRFEKDDFKSVLMHSGDIECLSKIYRGWGILPPEIQVLERELILRYGWDWFKYKVTGRIVEQSQDKGNILAEITFEKPDGCTYCHRAHLVRDDAKTVELKSSCGATKESVFTKYSVTSLWKASEKVVSLQQNRSYATGT